MLGITGFGAYLPKLRLQRQAIVDAHLWSDPSLTAQNKGERSICNWDEDSITMAVEATRNCLLSGTHSSPDQLILATTSAPFSDRQNAGIVATALGLDRHLASLDVSGSQRAATSGLLQGMAAVRSELYKNVLVVGTDKRKTRAASPGELRYGHGACALMLGTDKCIAEFLGGATVTEDFIDHYQLANEEFDYGWEERWIRDEGYGKIAPAAILKALEKAGVRAEDVDHFVMPAVINKAVSIVAKKCSIQATAIRDSLHTVCGETGVAHPFIMLVHTLQNAAKAGDLIVVAGFGQGCDALVFRVTDALSDIKTGGLEAELTKRQPESNYQKYLAFNNLINLELGIRSESRGFNTALSVLYRKREMLTSLLGGKCTQCGFAQFPRTEICVNPQCRASKTQEPFSFRDEPASVLSWSADYLAYIPNPPSHYGMITFDNGGRFMTDFTDVSVGELEVGKAVRMVFRIKSLDPMRGFTRYFWKATPIAVE